MSKRVTKTAYLFLRPEEHPGTAGGKLPGRTSIEIPLAAVREIPEIAARLYGEGIRQLIILAPGGMPAKFARDVLPALIQAAKARHPEMDLHVCPYAK